MRTILCCLLVLAFGCAREATSSTSSTSSTAQAEPHASTAPLAPTPQKPTETAAEPQTPFIRGDGLYRDAEIRKLSPVDIDAHTQSGSGVIELPILPVVLAGETKPRAQVFRELGLDELRVRDFRQEGINMVAFLSWQVSPSYDIACMTATNDGVLTEVALSNPSRSVYGVRLLKRP